MLASLVAVIALGSGLTFVPAAPQPGRMVSVAYHASTVLAGQPELVLRLQYRGPRDMMLGSAFWHRSPVVRVRLKRASSGDYVGSFRFADSAVYVAAVVSDTGATMVESNDGRLWEALVTDGRGQPRLPALLAEVMVHQDRGDWETALKVTEQATRLYPDSPLAWSIRLGVQQLSYGPSGLGAVQSLLAPRYAAMDKALRARPHANGDDLGAMRWLAPLMDSSSEGYWRERLMRDAPTHPLAIQERIQEIGKLSDAGTKLDSIEQMWQTGAPRHDALINMGFSTAIASRDPGAVSRWNDRMGGTAAERRVRVAQAFGRLPAFADTAVSLLRAATGDSASAEEPNALEYTHSSLRLSAESSRNAAREALGRALLRRGDSSEALRVLGPLADGAFNRNRLQLIGRLHLAARDTASALRLLGQLVVDPLLPAAFADTLRRMSPRLASDSGWQRFVNDERARVRAGLARGSSVTAVDADLPLAAWGHTELSKVSLTAGAPTLVAYWSRVCPGSRGMLPTLNLLSEKLQAHGGRLVVITSEAPSAALEAFVEAQHVKLTMYHDLTGAAQRRLAVPGTPFFVVLDSAGRVPFGSEYDMSAASAKIGTLLH